MKKGVLETNQPIKERGVFTKLRRSFKQEVIYIPAAKFKRGGQKGDSDSTVSI